MSACGDDFPCRGAGSRTAIVMAKAPIPGYAKSRLIPELGTVGAARLAEQLLEHAVLQAVAARFDAVELCAAPDVRHPVFRRLEALHGLRITDQGEGDLGQRMHRALARALQRHGRALLIGTDAPAVDAAVLRQASRALDDADAVFVPAFDGGYALVGLRRPAHPLFQGIAWSTDQVMHQTRVQAKRAGVSLVELDPVGDIDEAADLVHLPAGWLPRRA